jgi:hypothetical protein
MTCHTYASLLIAWGAHPKYIQAQLGHASIQTTLDRYGHVMPDVHEAEARKLAPWYSASGRQRALTRSRTRTSRRIGTVRRRDAGAPGAKWEQKRKRG